MSPKISGAPMIDTNLLISRFSPLKEVELCGHGTLASAHAIYESGRVNSRDTPIRFFTNFGEVLTAVGTSNGLIQLNFPATPPLEETLSPQDLADVLKGFSITSKDILFTGRTVYDLFIEISAAAFRKVDLLDYNSLKRLGGRGIILTCQGNTLGHNFTSRFFGPRFVTDFPSSTIFYVPPVARPSTSQCYSY